MLPSSLFKQLTLTLISCSLLACGGGGSSDSSEEPTLGNQTPTPTIPIVESLTGVFIDSAVSNIDYATETLSGLTNEAGEFQYVEDEQVTFSIGSLIFPTISAKNVVTLLDIMGETDPLSNSVVNMSRLLQSLDTDGNATNGISISDIAKDVATPLDFTQTPEDFAESTEVTTFLSAAGGATGAIISEEQSIAHLSQSLNTLDIVGTWKIESQDSEQFIALSFNSAGNLMLVIHGEAEDDGYTGVENMSYSWDSSTNALSFEMISDANGTWGFSHVEIESFTITGTNTAEIIAFDNGEEQHVPLSRLSNSDNTIVGSWVLPNEEAPESGQSTVINFFDDGTFLLIENSQTMPGMEFGSYTWDAATGQFSVDITAETNDDAGFSHAPITDITLTNEQLVITLTEGVIYIDPLNKYSSSGHLITANPFLASTPSSGLFIDALFSFEKTDAVIYGTGAVKSPEVAEKPLLLDIYQPVGDNVPALRPGVILVHGGGFEVGDRLKQAENAQQFAQRGYTAVSIDYRLTGDDPDTSGGTPILRATIAAIEDTLMAVKWMKDNAEDLGIDPNRIVLGGYSAGAVASLYAAFADQGEEYKVQAVLDLAGSYINVAQHIDSEDPALFIVHGVLEINEGVDVIEAAAKEAGIKHVVYHLDGIGHAETLYELDHWIENGVALRTLLSQFLFEALELASLGE
ncbi:MAG: alpha/beta hydrolase [Colwellia sp.]|nr:alpha/beta hydrolase [Colwellia sp.]